VPIYKRYGAHACLLCTYCTRTVEWWVSFSSPLSFCPPLVRRLSIFIVLHRNPRIPRAARLIRVTSRSVHGGYIDMRPTIVESDAGRRRSVCIFVGSRGREWMRLSSARVCCIVQCVISTLGYSTHSLHTACLGRRHTTHQVATARYHSAATYIASGFTRRFGFVPSAFDPSAFGSTARYLA